MRYIWELPKWPKLSMDSSAVERAVNDVLATRQALFARLRTAGFDVQQQVSLDSLTAEVVDSSRIESEVFSATAVRSSIARKIGLDPGTEEKPADKKAEGIIRVLLEATRGYALPLTEERLKGWHRNLMAAQRRITPGEYRTEPMVVASGLPGREVIHFEAPPPERLAMEMTGLFRWLDGEASLLHPLATGALAHLLFVTIHPFEDGNGRLGRAIGELYLAKADDSPARYYSYSSVLNQNRQDYYDELERTQKGDLDATRWTVWSLNAVAEAMRNSIQTVVRTLAHKALWKRASEAGMNERQRAMLPRLLDSYEGGVTTQKWAAHFKVSQDTATRDIAQWERLGILKRGPAGGRSTHYVLAEFNAPQSPKLSLPASVGRRREPRL